MQTGQSTGFRAGTSNWISPLVFVGALALCFLLTAAELQFYEDGMDSIAQIFQSDLLVDGPAVTSMATGKWLIIDQLLIWLHGILHTHMYDVREEIPPQKATQHMKCVGEVTGLPVKQMTEKERKCQKGRKRLDDAPGHPQRGLGILDFQVAHGKRPDEPLEAIQLPQIVCAESGSLVNTVTCSFRSAVMFMFSCQPA